MPFNIERFKKHLMKFADKKSVGKIMKEAGGEDLPDSPVKKAHYISSLMDILDKKLDDKVKKLIMENCGRECIGKSTIEKAKKLWEQSKTIDDFLNLLNENHIGGGNFKRKGYVIHAGYDRCYCGSVSKRKNPISSTYCNCSRGWYQQLFEQSLEKPVVVKLVDSIAHGADRCKFNIYI